MVGEIAYADVMGGAEPSTKPAPVKTSGIKFSDVASPEPPSTSIVKGFDDMLKGDIRFVERRGKASGDPLLQQVAATTHATTQFGRAAVSHPFKTSVNTVAALEQGAEGLLGMGVAGLAGIATWINEGDFQKGYGKITSAQEHYEKLVSAAQKVNHAVEWKQEEQAAQDLVNILPGAQQAAGDEVQQRSDAGLQAVGMSPAHAHIVSSMLGAGTQGVLALLALKPAAVAKGFEPLKPTDPAKPMPPETKASVDKVAASFDELAKKAPATADAIAAHVAKADAPLGDLLRDRVDKAQATKPEEIGKKSAEAEIAVRTKPKVTIKASAVPSREVVAKPKITARAVLTPEQAGASIRSTVKEGYAALEQKASIIPFPPRGPRPYQEIRGEFTSKFPYPDWVKSSADRKAYWRGLSKEDQAVRRAYYNEKVETRKATKITPRTKFADIDALHDEFGSIWATLKKALAEDKALKATDVLKIMHESIGGAKWDASSLKMILGKLREHLTEDATIVPHEGQIVSRGERIDEGIGGLYDPATHEIHLRLRDPWDKETATSDLASTPQHVVSLIHEIVHATTTRFMLENPLHPLTTEINELLWTARENMHLVQEEANQMGIYLGGGAKFFERKGEMGFVSGSSWGTMYGLTDAHELIAEAHANPQFQNLLIASSKFRKAWDVLKDITNKISAKIAEVLGVKDKVAVKLLDNILDTSSRIMKEQTKGDRLSAEIRRENPGAFARKATLVPEDPVLFTDDGKPVTKGEVESAARFGDKLRNLPGVKIAEAKLGVFFEDVARLVAPEALGLEAKKAGAHLAKVVSREMQKDTANYHKSGIRRTFWNHHIKDAPAFIKAFERGATHSGLTSLFRDPTMAAMAEGYRMWGNEIYLQDLKNGIKYDPIDNYLYHVFEDSEGVNRYFAQKYGRKFGDPNFTKDRSFDLYEEAIAAGFKPRYTNPEDIMLARQHASDVAEMKVDLFKDLEKSGLAGKIEKGKKEPSIGPNAEQWTSPNGDRYLVHAKANAPLHNYFNTPSLWSHTRKANTPVMNLASPAFKGLMFLKNSLVPIKLGLSAFHFVHVLTIDNITGMVRATKELASGTIGPGAWLTQMARSATYMDLISNPKMGGHIMRALKGQIPDRDLTAYDRLALQYMAEGGLIPTMSEQYRTNAITKLKTAIQQHSVTALWHAPFAMIGLIQRPMFEVWIPNLKIASYLKDIETALRTDPSLLQNPDARMMAFRKIAKSVDNRYGEMAYNTLFMNRLVKDLAVLNTLSLGWQMGIMREYGGAVLDTQRMITGPGSVRSKVAKGGLDRPMMVSFYTATGAALIGLTSWALSKQPPTGMDFIYPRTASLDEKGESPRANTMFFTREFVSLYDHMRDQGVVGGLSEMAMNKGSGVVGLITEWARGVNSYNEEIRDPNAEPFKKMEQTLLATWPAIEPISLASIDKGTGTGKEAGLAFLGFTPAPKYITDSATVSAIKSTYRKYHAGGQTSYEHAQYSNDAQELRKLYDADKLDEYSDLLDKIQEKYNLSSGQIAKLETNVRRGVDPILKMFERLDSSEKRRILDKMTEEEREKFLPHAGRDLRLNYEEVAQ